MEFRLYQIFVVLICLFFLGRVFHKYYRVRVNLIETVLGPLFWSFILLIGLLPDTIGGWLSRIFGFESNSNAVIFMILGIVLFVVHRLYLRIRLQDKHITVLTRRIAFLENQLEEHEDSLRS